MIIDILFTLSDFWNVDSALMQHDMANIQKKKDEEKVSSYFNALWLVSSIVHMKFFVSQNASS